MSGNCKDCQYWRHHVDGYGVAWNECEGVDSTSLEDPALNADFAIYAEAHDTSGLQVGLKTGPMFGCVQFKMVNTPAPEAEPVLVVETEPGYWTRGHYYEGSKSYIDPTKVWGLPAGTKLYTAPPAPSVPDDFYNAVANLSVELEELVAETSGVYGLHLNGDPSPWEEILEGGRFERISSLHVVQNLLATRQPKQPEQPEQPADLVRDAERYRWLQWSNWYVGPDSFYCTEGGDLAEYNDKNVSAENLNAEIDAAIAAKKGGA